MSSDENNKIFEGGWDDGIEYTHVEKVEKYDKFEENKMETKKTNKEEQIKELNYINTRLRDFVDEMTTRKDIGIRLEVREIQSKLRKIISFLEEGN